MCSVTFSFPSESPESSPLCVMGLYKLSSGWGGGGQQHHTRIAAPAVMLLPVFIVQFNLRNRSLMSAAITTLDCGGSCNSLAENREEPTLKMQKASLTTAHKAQR